MAVVGEFPWFGEPKGAVHVRDPGHDQIVIESQWIEAAGEPRPSPA